jgi:hypothetical protein
MRLWRRVRTSTLVGFGIALTVAAPVSAQDYENVWASVGVSPEPIARSPSLFGMGRLTLVGEDRHNRITLWEFAGVATGVGEADSTSTLELRPRTSSVSTVTDKVSQATPYERQVLAARGAGTGFEGWRRSGSVVYGLIGDVSMLRVDDPYAADIEHRRHYFNPRIKAALSGPMPYTESGRLRYALTLLSGQEHREDEFRVFVSNAAGEYIDRDGASLTPPNLFVPSESKSTTIGGGATVSYRIGSWLDAAVTGDLISTEFYGTSSAGRYTSESREQLRGRRPYPAGQATFVGHAGKHLEWACDGRIWDARYEQQWVFSISAGPGQNPLTGRGALANRDARGSQMRARVRWTQGPIELGGSFRTRYGSSVIDPPPANDPTSLNRFLYLVYKRPNADSLALPDSVSHQSAEERVWQAAGGLALRLPGRRGLLGVEYHASQVELLQDPGGLGPRLVAWDVRVGLEYRLSSVLTGRAGYVYQPMDRDELTKNNETIGNMGTIGLSVQPAGSVWSLDAGYGIEWWSADYGDPAQPRGSLQQLVSQLRWAF